MLDCCWNSQYWPHPFQWWCRHQKKKQGKENIHFGWWISFRKLVLFANQPWWLAINTLMISSPTPRARKSCLNNIFCIRLICPITNRFIQKLGESSWSFWRRYMVQARSPLSSTDMLTWYHGACEGTSWHDSVATSFNGQTLNMWLICQLYCNETLFKHFISWKYPSEELQQITVLYLGSK